MILINGRPKEFWDSLAYFLAKERKRHKADIDKINDDLLRLSNMGIEIPDPDPLDFIEVPL